ARDQVRVERAVAVADGPDPEPNQPGDGEADRFDQSRVTDFHGGWLPCQKGFLSGPPGGAYPRAGSGHSPLNTSTAGPVMWTWLSDSSQRKRRSPPGRWAVTCRPVRPDSTPATATEQAPVPQASVTPLPRSQVRIVTSPGEWTWTKWTLIR